MGKIYVPSNGVDSWKKLLADCESISKEGG